MSGDQPKTAPPKVNSSKGEIHTRLAAIMAEVEHIGKDRDNRQQGFKFRGIEDVMNALHVVFKKHGVFIVTEIVEHEFHQIETKSGTKGYHHLSRVAFHLTASDGSLCTILSLGEAMDYGDKGATKTLSIALKYALLNLFLIPTKETALEDPDLVTHQIASPAKPAKPAAKEDPRVTVAKRIEADPQAKWFEVVAWQRGPNKDKTLADAAANADVAAIQQLLDYIDPVALEHPLAVQRLKDAITEAKSTAEEKGTGEKPKEDDPF